MHRTRLVLATSSCAVALLGAACGPARPGAPPPSSSTAPSLAPGVPHCAAAYRAAAAQQQFNQTHPTVAQPPVSETAAPPPQPTTGQPPPLPSAAPTAVPTLVTASVLELGPAQLSRYPSPQYVVHLGTLVDVELPDEATPFCWSVPSSTDSSVLGVVVAGDDLAGGAHAQFRALHPGVATVDTTSACYTFPPCGASIALTEAVVTVSGAG